MGSGRILASYPITQFETVDWMLDWVGEGKECILGFVAGRRIYIASHIVGAGMSKVGS